ncbi:MAG: metal-dependent hydrolase [Spirochaetia bacterium]|jgi:membrane-bound metal-dependent hydrolase YbcI (DUF457 family)|nr:metal-dependent hydrolase [Spirochaetia bacterium]
MDIFSHTTAGLAAGALAAGMPRGASFALKLRILIAGLLGGAFPDIDALSLWKGFDAAIGRGLGLAPGRAIYHGKLWYSHHGFFHSIAAVALFACIAALLFNTAGLIRERRGFRGKFLAVFAAFAMGGFAHLLCDCITPASVWGGIRIFFPAEVYAGGWGYVWWWNNYDLFLIISGSCIINLLFLFVPSLSLRRIVPAVLTSAAVVLIAVQIHGRQFEYSYSGNSKRYFELEKRSKEEQRRVLGEKIYGLMEKLDKSINFYF